MEDKHAVYSVPHGASLVGGGGYGKLKKDNQRKRM